MTIRTSRKTVTFKKPFTLRGVEEILPAGAYTVETDEEPQEGVSFLAYRRILTLLHVPGRPGDRVLTRVLTVDPTDLDAALERDRARSGPTAGGDSAEDMPATKQRQGTSDLQAIERGENEGMMIHPD